MLRGPKWAAGLLIATAMSCSNMSDVVKEKNRGGGAERVYPVSVDQAWKISETILRVAETDRIQEHRSEGYMLTTVDVGPLSSGSYMGVWFEALDPAQTKVTFVRRRKIATQALRTLTEDVFHREFQALVELTAAVAPSCPRPPSAAGSAASAPAPSASAANPPAAP